MDLITKYRELQQKIESDLLKSGIGKELLFDLENYGNQLVESLNLLEDKCRNYEVLYENAQDSICIHTEQGNLLSVNKTACNTYQYTLQELLNMNLAQIDALEQVDYIKAKIEKVMKTGHAGFETKHIRKDGSSLLVEVNCKKIIWNGQLAILSICRDITEQKEAEQALKENEAKFREIIRQTNDGIVVFNEQKKIVIWNKGAEKIFGVSAAETINTNVVDHQFNFVPPSLKNKKLLDGMISGILNFETPELFYKLRELEVVNPESGKVKIIETELFPIKLEDYYLFGAVFRDITRKKKYEKKLLQLNANKDKFMQILAHDLRSPFNSLLGFSDLLLDNLSDYDKHVIEHQLRIQKIIIQKTLYLLEDLLLWSKSQLGMVKFKARKIGINKLCREIIDNLKTETESKNISVSFSKSENVAISADPYMMRTILRNLLTNAIKFTNRGGKINIYTEKKGAFLVVTVSDNGVGISPENQKKLWRIDTPFTTRGTNDEQGTGLGLWICKDFVEKHGGKMWVKSQYGKGSDFKFTVPL